MVTILRKDTHKDVPKVMSLYMAYIYRSARIILELGTGCGYDIGAYRCGRLLSTTKSRVAWVCVRVVNVCVCVCVCVCVRERERERERERDTHTHRHTRQRDRCVLNVCVRERGWGGERVCVCV